MVCIYFGETKAKIMTAEADKKRGLVIRDLYEAKVKRNLSATVTALLQNVKIRRISAIFVMDAASVSVKKALLPSVSRKKWTKAEKKYPIRSYEDLTTAFEGKNALVFKKRVTLSVAPAEVLETLNDTIGKIKITPERVFFGEQPFINLTERYGKVLGNRFIVLHYKESFTAVGIYQDGEYRHGYNVVFPQSESASVVRRLLTVSDNALFAAESLGAGTPEAVYLAGELPDSAAVIGEINRTLSVCMKRFPLLDGIVGCPTEDYNRYLDLIGAILNEYPLKERKNR